MRRCVASFIIDFIDGDTVVYDIDHASKISDDINDAIMCVVDDDRSDESIAVAKSIIDGLTRRMTVFAEETVDGCALRASVLLEFVSFFEKIWPRTNLANFVLKIVYEEFAEKMVKKEIGRDWNQAIQKYRTVLIVVSRLQIAKNRDFIQRMIYRNSLLPTDLQNGTKQFFTV